MTAARNDLRSRKLGEDIRVLVDLFFDRQLMSNHYEAEAEVFDGRSNFPISCSLRRCIVVRPVNENTDSGPSVAFVVEIGLNHNLVGRPVLRQIG